MKVYAMVLLAASVALSPGVASAQETELAALRAAGRSPEALLRLGRALRRAGRFDEAYRTLQAVRAPNLRADALWEAARVRFDQGNFRLSQAACRAIPEGLARHVCLARAHIVWNRVALAEREVAIARGLQPNDPQLQLAIAEMARLNTDLARGEAAYQAAASGLPGDASPWVGLGSLQELLQHDTEALAAFRRAAEVDPGDPQANLALGVHLLRRQHNATEALAPLRRATEGRLNWPEALVALGQALLETQAWAEALAAFQNAVRLSRSQPGGQTGLGRALNGLGRWADAEAPFRLAITQVGNDAQAYMGLADVLEHTSRDIDAMETWEAAVDRAPHDLTPRMRAAMLAHRTQQNSLARAHLDRVLAVDGRYGPALVLRAEIAVEDNDRPTARSYYRQALDAHDAPLDRAAIEARLAELDRPGPPPRRR
ncbi:MAG: tetratricopeptide repeat protein [Deltaproteobacteria bacterium]|nr:tetratricopeptide repeat protein [Deltaproteobacteria bacterium]